MVVKWIGKQKHDRLENNNHEVDPSSIKEIEGEIKKCHQIFDEYKTMVDPGYLADISDRLNLVDREFKNEFVGLDSDRKALTDMLQTLENVDQVSHETLQSMESDLKKITPKTADVEKIYAQVKKIVTVSLNWVILCVCRLLGGNGFL